MARRQARKLPLRLRNNDNNANNMNRGPRIGEARVHRKSGLIYVFERIPGTDRLGWLRMDTWFWGAIRNFPWRTAKPKYLVKFPRRALGLKDTPGGVSVVEMDIK